MTGSASSSNTTTQWTFRDGREYVLSLTTTETPKTISFWISDKITGEEWTGCYDENCIENVTKRTGCFKSFSTFLSMIKSAILKKSESVILELLNTQDLAAISIHRHKTVSNESGINSPLNYELYGDVSVSSTSYQHTKPHNVPTDHRTNNGNTINGSNYKAQPMSALNRRKYLIVTYIGEFDKVHYPLPLNYTNPPDLNVMQNTIINLKAEVTSLKSAKKELEVHLKSVTLSGCGIPQHSHENKDVNVNCTPSKTSSDQGTSTEEQVLVDQIYYNCKREDIKGTKRIGDLSSFVETADRASSTCIKCSATVEKLRVTIRNLENNMSMIKAQYLENLEKLENENSFLRHKVDTSEKYELELWSHIKELKEKVEAQEHLEKEREIQAEKDARKNRFHLSRHDLFYNEKHSAGVKPVNSKLSTTFKTPAKLSLERGNAIRNSKTHVSQRKRSNSNSTVSYSSVREQSNDSITRRNRTQSKDNYRASRSSSYQGINFIKGVSKSRSASYSPGKRFDPTAYIAEKRMKQKKIANLRMQRIEARMRSESAGSLPRPIPSTSPYRRTAHFTQTTIRPTALSKKTLSREHTAPKVYKKMDNGDGLRFSKSKTKFSYVTVKSPFEGIHVRSVSRPSSADSCRPKTAPAEQRYLLDEKWMEHLENLKFKIGDNIRDGKYLSRTNTTEEGSPVAPKISRELNDRYMRSPVTKVAPDKINRKTTNNAAINTSFTCDQSKPLINLEEYPKSLKSCVKGKNDKNKRDISFLQEKLSALNAFLETCKPKDKDNKDVS